MKNIKDILILILGLIILVFVLMKGCKSDFMGNNEIVIPEIKTITTHDTIMARDTIISFKNKYYPKYDTIIRTDTTWDQNLCNFERTYNDTMDDENITIFNRNISIGIIKESKTSYKLKVPLIINNNTTVTLTDIKFKPSKTSFYTGLEISGNFNSLNVSPSVTINVKRSSLSVRYGILNKSIGINASYMLFSSKK